MDRSSDSPRLAVCDHTTKVRLLNVLWTMSVSRSSSDRSRVEQLALGSRVIYLADTYRVSAILNLNTVQLTHETSGALVNVDVRLLDNSEPSPEPAEWEAKQALERFDKLAPFLSRPCGSEDIQKLTTDLGIGRAQIFNELRRLRQAPHPASLIPHRRGRKKGARYLQDAVEKIISAHIQAAGSSLNQFDLQFIHQEIEADCIDAGLNPPHIRTVRRRITDIKAELLLRKRLGTSRAKERVTARGGSIKTEAPLSVVEVDHSPLDIFLVSSSDRSCIGRAYLTVVMDTFSRCILGFHIGLDPPSALTVALALTHAVTNKDEWLCERDLPSGSWPMYGLMRQIRVDNAQEFKSLKFEAACLKWGITVQHRKKKEDGGIVERFIGTLQRWAAQEPGASGNDPKKSRGQRDAREFAQMTIAEAERWLARQIVGKYHLKKHRSLDTSPRQAWINWFAPITGNMLPVSVSDRRSFFISFLPSQERVISHDGIRLFGERYFNDELRTEIHPGVKRVVHYDPRMMGRVYVELSSGFTDVGYADASKRRMPLFEILHQRKIYAKANPDEFDQLARVEITKANRQGRALSKKATRRARAEERKHQADLAAHQVRESTRSPTKKHQESQGTIDYSRPPKVRKEGPV